jgi:hypothetical protein
MGVKETPRRPGYERRDISLGAVALFAAGLVIALIVVQYLALGTFHHLAQQPSGYPPPSPLVATREKYAGPRLLVDQKLVMEKFRASEDILLNNYGWVDRSQGIVRIPIDRAIDLLAQQGAPR